MRIVVCLFSKQIVMMGAPTRIYIYMDATFAIIIFFFHSVLMSRQMCIISDPLKSFCYRLCRIISLRSLLCERWTRFTLCFDSIFLFHGNASHRMLLHTQRTLVRSHLSRSVAGGDIYEIADSVKRHNVRRMRELRMKMHSERFQVFFLNSMCWPYHSIK